MVTKRDSLMFFEQLNAIAESNGGTLLDSEWRGASIPHNFTFSDGTPFTRTPNQIREYGWPKQTRFFQKTHSDKLKLLSDISKKRGGKLLSTVWVNSSTEYEFEDSEGKIFKKKAVAVLNGGWSNSETLIAEQVCRQAMEHLFQKQFEKTTSVLHKLKTNRKFNLELDGFNYELMIGFEYQGYPSHWNPKNKKYKATRERDLFKQEYCRNNNIVLVVIPPIHNVKKLLDSLYIKEHVLTSIKEAYSNLVIPVPILNNTPFNINLKALNQERHKYNALQKLAEKNNCTLIEKTWLGGDHILHRFQHSDGSIFVSTPALLKRHWPKKPNLLIPDNLVDVSLMTASDILSNNCLNKLIEIAKQNNAILLDSDWKGIKYEYSFKLEDGQLIKRTYKDAYATNSLGMPNSSAFKYIKSLAIQNNAELLESMWLGYHIAHKFKLQDGDIVKIPPATLLKHGWIKNIDRYKKRFIRTDDDRLLEIKDIAECNSGRLVEKQWLGPKVKHRFKFDNGIEFSMTPVQLLKRGWPKDKDLYIKNHVYNKDEIYLMELKEIARQNKGVLLTKTWLGAVNLHIFKFNDGRIFKMAPSKLKTRGWPKDPDAYLKRYEPSLSNADLDSIK